MMFQDIYEASQGAGNSNSEGKDHVTIHYSDYIIENLAVKKFAIYKRNPQ